MSSFKDFSFSIAWVNLSSVDSSVFFVFSISSSFWLNSASKSFVACFNLASNSWLAFISSLDSAVKDGCDELIVITHYPPTNDKLETSEFTKIYEGYNVKKVIYGHLHGKESFEMGLKGQRNGVEYILASSDYINFEPIKILE